jgi:predicted ATPase
LVNSRGKTMSEKYIPRIMKKQTGMHIRSLHLIHDTFPTREAYPFNREIFQKTVSIDLFLPVTFFTGENRTGKSTLLRAIARCCHIHIWELDKI